MSPEPPRKKATPEKKILGGRDTPEGSEASGSSICGKEAIRDREPPREGEVLRPAQ